MAITQAVCTSFKQELLVGTHDFTDTNKAVAVLDFGGDKTSTSGTFTIQFPTADASDAILRLA
jgi:hypothetical protein